MKPITYAKSLRHKLYLYYFHSRPIEKNKVLFWADSFKSYGCSPKYIAQYLLEHEAGRYDLVWAFAAEREIPEDFPKEIRTVRYFSIEYLREISTAKFIVCNARTGPYHYFHKRPGQTYIQTWHSSLRLKKIEGDAADTLPTSYIESAMADSAKIDLLLSGCRFSTEIFRRAFWYDGEILEGGTPRCDVLLGDTKHIREKVFRRYGIPEESKLVLYAPTFRNDKKAQTHGMDFEELKKALEKKTEDVWTIGCRFHPNIEVGAGPSGCISMTGYPDMQELIAAADCLITDYSSCMFDMAIARKPCLLYAPDMDSYVRNERGLYFDVQKLPFPLCRSMEEVTRAIERFSVKEYLGNTAAFLCAIGSFEDGQAAARTAAYMEKQILSDIKETGGRTH